MLVGLADDVLIALGLKGEFVASRRAEGRRRSRGRGDPDPGAFMFLLIFADFQDVTRGPRRVDIRDQNFVQGQGGAGFSIEG